MKRFYRYAPALSVLLYGLPLANAQSSFDLNIGFGTAHASASGSGIDNALSPTNAFGTCAPSSGDSFCQATPDMGGFFLGFGGDVMLKKHYGIGAELNVQPGRYDYGPLQYRQMFYDFNGIVAPINEKRVELQLQGGIGGARTGFSISESSCVGIAVCSNVTQAVGTVTHFQVHAGVGVQLFLTKQLFIRPEFDLHYVPNLTQQFGSNAVPQASVWVGYSWGDR
jgi:hypothetical protein